MHGNRIKLGFQITQHLRDSILIKSLITLFKCGRVEPSGESAVSYVVTKLSDITGTIVPFFENYPLVGNKAKDFEDWKNISKLMKSKAHLTKEGLEEILKIRSGMNSKRSFK